MDRVINCSESSPDFKLISDYALLHLKTAFSAKDYLFQCFMFPQLSPSATHTFSYPSHATIYSLSSFPALLHFFIYPMNHLLLYFPWITSVETKKMPRWNKHNRYPPLLLVSLGVYCDSKGFWLNTWHDINYNNSYREIIKAIKNLSFRQILTEVSFICRFCI